MYFPSVRVEEANPLCKTCKEANASDQYVMWYYDTPPPPAFNNILSAPWWSRGNSDVVSATDDHRAVKNLDSEVWPSSRKAAQILLRVRATVSVCPSALLCTTRMHEQHNAATTHHVTISSCVSFQIRLALVQVSFFIQALVLAVSSKDT